MIFPHEFYEAKDYLFMPQLTDARLHMGNIVWLAISQPQDKVQKFGDRNTVHLLSIEGRGKAPQFSKDVVRELEEHFKDNNISSHLYVGYNDDNKSFSRIHRDKMDVVIVQQYGTIDLSIWTSDLNEDVVGSEEATLIERRTLQEGDAVYIPSGTYHYIEPHSQRITYSFGIE